jgi:hypothetical protein
VRDPQDCIGTIPWQNIVGCSLAHTVGYSSCRWHRNAGLPKKCIVFWT